MRAHRLVLAVGFVAAMGCVAGRAEDVPIAFSNTYGAFSVKWVTDATTQTRVQKSAQKSAGKAQKKLAKSLTTLVKKPDLKKLDKMKLQVETLLAKGKGQSSMLLWASLIQTVGLNPQAGMTGSVSFGDSASGGYAGAFTLTQKYSGTVEGHPVTVYYSTPPTATDATFAFHALIISDELSALLGAGSVGVWVTGIADPALIAPLGQFGVTNTTTSADGTPVNLSVGLRLDGAPAHAGTASFSDTYFSIQDLFGVGVPPQAVEAAKANMAKLLAKMVK